MSKAAMNLQDSFLNQVRRENTEVKVLLVNGTVLRGSVKGFDNFTLILNSRNGQHLIYKHAIAQLVNFRSGGQRREGEEGQGKDESNEHAVIEDIGESAAAPVSARPEPRPASDNRPRPRKDGFNKIDLSGVNVNAEGERAKPTA